MHDLLPSKESVQSGHGSGFDRSVSLFRVEALECYCASAELSCQGSRRFIRLRWRFSGSSRVIRKWNDAAAMFSRMVEWRQVKKQFIAAMVVLVSMHPSLDDYWSVAAPLLNCLAKEQNDSSRVTSFQWFITRYK